MALGRFLRPWWVALRRRRAVAALVAAVVACVLLPASGAVAGTHRPQQVGSRWPVPGADGAGQPVVTRGWDPPARRWEAGHRGVDLRAPAGTRVRAVADGRVSFAGQVGGRGVVTVTLAGTGRPPLRVTYQPVRPAVHAGDRVRAGDVVGRVTAGRSHCSGSCLHWGLRRGERYLNPLSVLPARLWDDGPSRLLPVFGVPVPAGEGPAAGTEPSAAEGRTGGTAAVVLLAAAALWAHGRLRGRVSRRRRAGPGRRRYR